MLFKRGDSPGDSKQGLYPHWDREQENHRYQWDDQCSCPPTSWICVRKDLPILLAAPTGRAARRMNELTGLPSATIHRHLGMTGDDDTSHFRGLS